MLFYVFLRLLFSIFFILSICSAEMSRDLAGEVERLMKAGNSYIKKKVKEFSIHVLYKCIFCYQRYFTISSLIFIR